MLVHVCLTYLFCHPALAPFAIPCYYLFISLFQKVFAYHNLMMSLMSIVLFVGTLYYVWVESFVQYAHPDNASKQQLAFFQWHFCFSKTIPSTTATGLWYFSYLYYLSKYVELFDTVFLALKGKLVGWGGLNVYHHAVVIFMSWWWIEYQQSMQVCIQSSCCVAISDDTVL